MMERVRPVMLATKDPQVEWLSGYVRPICQQLGYCTQGKRGCGDYPTKNAVLECAEEAELYRKPAPDA